MPYSCVIASFKIFQLCVPHLHLIDQVFMTAQLKTKVMAYSHDILLLIWQKRKQCQALILLYDFLSQGSGEEAAHFLSGLRRPHDLRARCYSTSFLPFFFVVSAEGPSTRVSSLPTATRPLWMSLL